MHIITTHLFDPSSNIGKLDTYFFSVAYLYRHSLELILKAIGFKYIQAKQDRQAFIKDTFHNLHNLLQSGCYLLEIRLLCFLDRRLMTYFVLKNIKFQKTIPKIDLMYYNVNIRCYFTYLFN